MAIVHKHEFAFIDDAVVHELITQGTLPASFVFPGWEHWFPMWTTNEDRLEANRGFLFVCPEGIGGTAVKYNRVADGGANDGINGCVIYRHCKGKHRALLVREIPCRGCLMNIMVEPRLEQHTVLITVHYLSGRIAFQKEYPLDSRLTVKELDYAVISNQGSQGVWSINTRVKSSKSDPLARAPLALRAMVWRPVTVPGAAPIPHVPQAPVAAVPAPKTAAKAKAKAKAVGRKRPASAIE